MPEDRKFVVTRRRTYEEKLVVHAADENVARMRAFDPDLRAERTSVRLVELKVGHVKQECES